MVKQYVGARYVPKFASPVEWAPSTSYDALTIVTYNNSSYTSKIPVPATVGDPADNPDYWALTGNYNAQVEQYRQETETVSNNLTTEITNRKNADTTLQGQITTLNQRLNDGVFHKTTNGIFEDGVALSALANNANGRPEIMGFRNAYEAANYNTRDGVGLFVSIRGKNPTLTVASTAGITYTSNAVIIDSSLMYDLSNIKEGMVIDTMHDTPFSSIVSSVDLANRTIFVEGGWYLKGSTTPSVPTSDVGFYVAKITFVWGENTAVHLYDSDETTRGAIAEYDIVNDKTGGYIDGLSFVSKSTVKNGHVIRTIIADGAKGFKQFAIIDGCDVAIIDNFSQKTIRKNHNNNNEFLINSQNSEDDKMFFNLRNDGRSNRLRGEFKVVSGTGSIENEVSNMILLNVNSDADLYIRDAFGYNGELFYIDNISDYTVAIRTRNHGFSEGATASTELRVHAKDTILLLSDGTYWQVLIRHSKMKSLGNISTESVIATFGASNYVISGGAIHGRLFATATSNIANNTKIASLPRGIYSGLGNVAVKTLQGHTATFTIGVDGTIKTSSAITNGDQFLLEFSTLVQ